MGKELLLSSTAVPELNGDAALTHLANGVEARLQVAQVALRVGHAAALALDGRRYLPHARLQLLRALPQHSNPKDQQGHFALMKALM